MANCNVSFAVYGDPAGSAWKRVRVPSNAVPGRRGDPAGERRYLSGMRSLLASALLTACADSADSGAPPGGTGATLAHRPLRACDRPGARSSSGPMVPWSLGPAWDAQPPADNLSWQYTGGGMAVADLNGDDRPDVYLPSSADSQLLLSDGDTWRDGSDGLPVAESTDLGVGAIVADVDDDGDLDLYTLVLHGQNRLLQNDGSGRFVDVTEAAGLLAGEWDTTHAVFADVSGDGVLDLLVANHFEGPHLGDAIISGDFLPAHDNRLYVGDGSGGFTDATETLPAAFRSGYGFVVMAEDFDGDGHDELLSVNDFGPFWEPNTVLRRDGVDWRIDEGFEGLDIGVYGMGAGVGDLNADGTPDLLITSWGELVLLESTGDGAWFRAGAARGIQMAPDQSTAWGAILADLDNDTDLDATVAMGPLVMPSDVAEQQAEVRGLITLQNQPDALYVQDEDGRFTDVADAWGVGHPGVSRGVLPVDLDGDGWLDLMRRGLDGPAVAWRARCGNRGALVVSLAQPAPNVRAVGAQLEVRGAGRVQWRRIRAGGTGHAVGADPIAHFGLGGAGRVDLRITWPDGAVDSFGAVAPGRVRITRP